MATDIAGYRSEEARSARLIRVIRWFDDFPLMRIATTPKLSRQPISNEAVIGLSCGHWHANHLPAGTFEPSVLVPA